MRCEHQSVVVCESFGLVSRLMLVCSPTLIEAEALSVHLQDMDMVSKAGPSADLEWRERVRLPGLGLGLPPILWVLKYALSDRRPYRQTADANQGSSSPGIEPEEQLVHGC